MDLQPDSFGGCKGGESMRVALYARVSTDRQEQEQTIQSQLEALRSHARAQGYTVVAEFVDEGYSGASLERPALDRLRDVAARREFERVLVQAPDRLSRRIGYLVLLLEELQRRGVSVEFLNHPVDNSPEGQLLLNVQGAVAEYERAKIAERTRRGKVYWARQGAVMPGFVPYGYRYVPRDGDRRGRLEIKEAEAAVIRGIFRAIAEEGLSLRAVAARLQEQGVPTPRGGKRWRASTVWSIVRDETYTGTFYYRKVDYSEAARASRAPDGQPPKKPWRPRDEWIAIPVPAIVDRATWERAQAQLAANAKFSPRHNTRRQYLLRGLMVCGRCGHHYVGATSNRHRYYRCGHYDPVRVGADEVCRARWVRADAAEQAVWEAVAGLLRDPALLAAEYRRRLGEAAPDPEDSEAARLAQELQRLQRQEERLLDAYQAEALSLEALKTRMAELAGKRQAVQQRLRVLEHVRQSRERVAQALATVEAFRQTVAEGLESLDFSGRQKLLRLLVERIVVEEEGLRVEVVVPPDVLQARQETAAVGVSLRPWGLGAVDAVDPPGNVQAQPAGPEAPAPIPRLADDPPLPHGSEGGGLADGHRPLAQQLVPPIEGELHGVGVDDDPEALGLHVGMARHVARRRRRAGRVVLAGHQAGGLLLEGLGQHVEGLRAGHAVRRQAVAALKGPHRLSGALVVDAAQGVGEQAQKTQAELQLPDGLRAVGGARPAHHVHLAAKPRKGKPRR